MRERKQEEEEEVDSVDCGGLGHPPHTRAHPRPTLLLEESAPSIVGSRQSADRKSEVASGRHSLAPWDQRHSKARTGPGIRTPRKGPMAGHRSPKGGLLPGWTARLPAAHCLL